MALELQNKMLYSNKWLCGCLVTCHGRSTCWTWRRHAGPVAQISVCLRREAPGRNRSSSCLDPSVSGNREEAILGCYRGTRVPS